MGGFKDAVAEDVTGVFLNPDEFADSHVFDGVELIAVVTDIDDAMTQGSSRDDFASPQTLALLSGQVRLYCDVNDLPDAPLPDAAVDLDGLRYIVESVSTQMGMYVIDLVRASS